MTATNQADAVADAGIGGLLRPAWATKRRLTRQLAVTIVAPVRPRQLASLRRLLERIGEDPAGNGELPFGRLRTAHFARLVLLEKSRDLDGEVIPAQLVYMSDVDEPLSDHLDDLLALAPGLDGVFGRCEGYPPRRELTRASRRRWLERHMIKTQAFYVNTVGRTLPQIQQESLLQSEIEQFLDRGEWDGCEPLEVRAAIQDYVSTHPELAWARAAAPGPGPLEVGRDVAAVAVPVLGALAAAPVLVPLLPFYAVLLRWHELHDVVETAPLTAAHERRLAELEDLGPTNQFSAVGFVKPGLLRRVTMDVALRGLDLACRHVFNRGSLVGIKTIHFAHWTKLESGGQFMFASNYDGTVKSYNDDFIDKVWWGTNLVFSNGVGWPRSFLLIWGGLRDEQAFKSYLRRHQIPTQVWYAAYPDLSVVNIDNNAKIRAGLFGSMNREEAERWLRLI
jgi:hypothetical protein